MPFSYGCAFNVQTGATSGIVFRDLGALRPSTETQLEPDLASVLPEACEGRGGQCAEKQAPARQPHHFRLGFTAAAPAPMAAPV